MRTKLAIVLVALVASGSGAVLAQDKTAAPPASSISGRLSDPDPEIRIEAADALRDCKDQAMLPPLLKAISDQDPRVQFRAVVAVNEIAGQRRGPQTPSGDHRGPILLPSWYEGEVKRNKDKTFRGLLALACGQASPDIPHAIPTVMQCLGDGGDELFDAAYLILPMDSVTGRLAECLDRDDVRVRRGAARMLFESELLNRTAMRTRDALPALTRGLNDKDQVVRFYCLIAFSKHEAADLDQLTRLAQNETDSAIRCAAVDAIRRRRPDDSIKILRRLTNDPNARVRVRAAFALGSIAVWDKKVASSLATNKQDALTPRARDLIQVAIRYDSDDEDLTVTKGDSIGQAALSDIFAAIRQERARPLPEIENITPSDRFDVDLLSAIGAVGPAAAAAVPWILEELRTYDALGSGDYRADVKAARLQAALYLLSQIGATKELVRALDDRHPVVRTTAAMALSSDSRLAAKVAPILADSLNRDCWGVCVYSQTHRSDVSCLAEMGHHAVPAMLEMIRDRKSASLATESISHMAADAPRVVPILRSTLEDSTEQAHVRIAAAKLLGQVGKLQADTLPLLTRTLQDKQQIEGIRVAAAEGLASLGPKARSALLANAEDPSRLVRAAVRKALAQAEQ